MSLIDGNIDLWGLDIAAASADTIPVCAFGPASAYPLEEAGTIAGLPTTFMVIDRVEVVGCEQMAFT